MLASAIPNGMHIFQHDAGWNGTEDRRRFRGTTHHTKAFRQNTISVATTLQWVKVDCDGVEFTAVPLLDTCLDWHVLRVPFTSAHVRAAPKQGHTEVLAPDDERALRVTTQNSQYRRVISDDRHRSG